MKKDKETNQEKTTNSSSKKKITIGIIVVLVIAIIIALICKSCSSDKQEKSGGLELGVIDIDSLSSEKDKQKVQDALNKKVEEGMVNIFMNTDIRIKEGSTTANLMIQNTEKNHYDLQVNVREVDSDELLYESPVVGPGYKIESDNIKKQLEEGKYECLAEFNVIDKENNTKVNTIGLKVNITVYKGENQNET